MSPAKPRASTRKKSGPPRRYSNRSARRISCSKCGAEVLEGWDGKVMALLVRVDPIAVDAVGEVLAVASGRASFDARTYGKDVELDRRDRWHWQGSPGSDTSRAVYLEHVCGNPPKDPHLQLDLLGDEDLRVDPDAPPPY